MDSIDRKIVAALQRNGRLKISELSEMVGLSPTPCARRVGNLEESGVISGYSARVDQAKLGLPVTIFVAVELERQSTDALQAFEKAVRKFDQVMECYLMTGTRDILLRVVAEDLPDFDRFLEDRLMRVPGIRNTRSSFTLRTMIQRDALPSC
ncbi:MULTISPECIES: Lrp/AsnC family transcriptional regulator [unclassified Leisingera]|uniref:Lrp/AsnC family transcriptional regulator n=1 Tax=unclassified Leisingera TaxID=2614906 RepID=UPI0002D3BC64|nr:MULTISPECIES: Lrp/AsnC family transcriptional regulator [unclassified Leisingera]KIC19081.1 AsnC family transcriptional regulator [Leisingera sp. ANG-DT]KIC26430.1 AsnC family transcriptional regulator [Leisingera sp. ANG-S3]KIC29859.1 AsnC family transcriptional regulator [Leisingera sp. ANG-M6]KIC33429.1 AsnC family transcriptional regulator [Leisingera sp. ANG-S5]KIC52749.1 AsnC family transcriptional regulator [Leisingera sp. ANG-S]